MKHRTCQRIRKLGFGRTFLLVNDNLCYTVASRIDGIGDVVLKLRIGNLFCNGIIIEIHHTEKEQQDECIHPIHAELYLGAFLVPARFYIGHYNGVI